MDEYLKYLNETSLNGKTIIDTKERFNAHIYLKQQPTINISRTQYSGTTEGSKHPELKYFENKLQVQNINNKTFSTVSTVLEPIVESIKYTPQTVASLIKSKDALMINGMKWLSEQSLQREGFTTSNEKESLIQTLTLFQLHHVMYKNNFFYTINDVRQRIPIALTRINLRDKIFLSLNNNLHVRNIIHSSEIPTEWFDKLNLKT
jgi:hypothetical protein